MATQSGFKRGVMGLVAVAVLAGGGWYWKNKNAGTGAAADPKTEAAGGKSEPGAAAKADPAKKGSPGADRNRPVPAVIDQVRVSDVPVLVNALGNVTARQQSVVRARVDGLLEALTFKEGALVQKGAPLARLDRRSFEAALASVQGQLAKDQAQLDIATVDLQRYRKLLTEDSIASQQVDAQAALVKQLQGVLAADKAAVATAKLNLSFTVVTAPISGRTGLRQVDPGNMVKASDANGIVVISEVQPITVVFSVPQEAMPNVVSKFQEAERKGEAIKVQALDRDGRTPLEGGKLLAIDNQTDPATGSTKLKAIFANKSGALFPGQFVNVRMIVDTLAGALTIPQSAVQRGSVGTFVYVVTPEKTASVRRVTLGNPQGERIVVTEGLSEGESVVIDGADKLREGAPVTTVSPVPSARRRGGAGGPGGAGAPGGVGAQGGAPSGAGGEGPDKAGAAVPGAASGGPAGVAAAGKSEDGRSGSGKSGSSKSESGKSESGKSESGKTDQAGKADQAGKGAGEGAARRELTPEQRAAFQALTPEQKEAIRNMTPEQRAAMRARRAAREAGAEGDAGAAATKP